MGQLFSAMVTKQHSCTTPAAGQGVKESSCHPPALRVTKGVYVYRLKGFHVIPFPNCAPIAENRI